MGNIIFRISLIVKKVLWVIGISTLILTSIMAVSHRQTKYYLLDSINSRDNVNIKHIDILKYVPSPTLGTVGLVKLVNDVENVQEDLSTLLTIIEYSNTESQSAMEVVEEKRETLLLNNQLRKKDIEKPKSINMHIENYLSYGETEYRLIELLAGASGPVLEKYVEVNDMSNILDKIDIEYMATYNNLFILLLVEYFLLLISITVLYKCIVIWVGYIMTYLNNERNNRLYRKANEKRIGG